MTTKDTEWLTVILLNLAGYGYHQKFSSTEMGVSHSATLEREPGNHFDSNAVAVVVSSPNISVTGQKIGYVPRAFSEIFSNLLQAGLELRATVQVYSPTAVSLLVQTKKRS